MPKELMEIRSSSSSSEEEEKKACSMTLYIPLEEREGEGKYCSFNFENAVCNHGFFMMAPNVWIPSTKTLQRPLRLADSCTSILTSISHPHNENSIHVRLHNTNQYVSPKDQQVILDQVARMLRLSDRDEKDVKQFHQLQPKAKNMCFGRIFRSPSIFEDMVKSILLCHCTWGRTLDMSQALCDLQFELKGLKRGNRLTREMSRNKSKSVDEDHEAMDQNYSMGNFPNSMELSILDEKTLRDRCNLGYRAKIIIELARSIHNGELQLNKFEKALASDKSIEKIYEMLNKKRGFGPFACDNVFMCIGYYQRIPTDTETFRHIKELYGRNNQVTIKDVKEIYDKYAPFQCLAYWLELCEYYQRKFGKLSELPRSKYHIITGSYKIGH